MKEKIKKISKYVVNILNMINMLLLGLANVWNWNIDKVNKVFYDNAGSGTFEKGPELD